MSSSSIKLLKENYSVIGIDNINNYYSVNFKKDRLRNIERFYDSSKNNWRFYKVSIEDKEKIFQLFHENRPTIVINLAAQAE